MDANDYQMEALRTESPFPYDNVEIDEDSIRLMQGLMGLNGEAGEAIDIFKKHFFQGHELDREHLAKELGDIAWYLAVSADALGYDLETIFVMNVEKLRARYPEGFEVDRSVNRPAEDE